jgi:MFS family permease
VFWINAPIVALVLCGTVAFVPESRSEQPSRVDVGGQLLILTGLASLIFTIIELPKPGDRDLTVAAALLAAATITLFLAVERHTPDPLVDLRFFASIPFSAGMVIAVVNYSAIGGVLFLNTLHLQQALGFSTLRAGLYTAPMALMTALSAQLSGKLMARFGSRTPLIASGASLIAGAGMSAAVSAHYSTPLLVLSLLLLGIGFGGANTPVNTIAMSGMPRDRAGVAGAIASSSRQTGQALGVAVTGAIFAGALGDRPITKGFGHAALPAWLMFAACGAAIIALGIPVASERGSDRRRSSTLVSPDSR